MQAAKTFILNGKLLKVVILAPPHATKGYIII
jgi:hypothetical protein